MTVKSVCPLYQVQCQGMGMGNGEQRKTGSCPRPSSGLTGEIIHMHAWTHTRAHMHTQLNLTLPWSKNRNRWLQSNLSMYVHIEWKGKSWDKWIPPNSPHSFLPGELFSGGHRDPSLCAPHRDSLSLPTFTLDRQAPEFLWIPCKDHPGRKRVQVTAL